MNDSLKASSWLAESAQDKSTTTDVRPAYKSDHLKIASKVLKGQNETGQFTFFLLSYMPFTNK